MTAAVVLRRGAGEPPAELAAVVPIPLPAEAPIPGPPDQAWAEYVAAFPPERQAVAVAAKFSELNPGFNADQVKFGFDFRHRSVKELEFSTDTVAGNRTDVAAAQKVKAFLSPRDPSRAGDVYTQVGGNTWTLTVQWRRNGFTRRSRRPRRIVALLHEVFY